MNLKKKITIIFITGRVWAVQFDKNKIVSGAADRSIKIWDMKTLKCINTLPKDHKDGLSCLQFDKSGIAVSGAADSLVKGFLFNVLFICFFVLLCFFFFNKIIYSFIYLFYFIICK